jgi:hypothetical protein
LHDEADPKRVDVQSTPIRSEIKYCLSTFTRKIFARNMIYCLHHTVLLISTPPGQVGTVQVLIMVRSGMLLVNQPEKGFDLYVTILNSRDNKTWEAMIRVMEDSEIRGN